MRASSLWEVWQRNRLTLERVGAVTQELDLAVAHERVADGLAARRDILVRRHVEVLAGRPLDPSDEHARRERRRVRVAVVAPERLALALDPDVVPLVAPRAPEAEQPALRSEEH